METISRAVYAKVLQSPHVMICVHTVLVSTSSRVCFRVHVSVNKVEKRRRTLFEKDSEGKPPCVVFPPLALHHDN